MDNLTSPTTRAGRGVRAEMTWIPSRQFLMGSDGHYPEEAPAHLVSVDGFYIDAHPVTNDEFTVFVEDTGYVTQAEIAPEPSDFPGADPAMLVASSAVFTPPSRPVALTDAYRWWSSVAGADWRHPEGPGSGVDALGAHPVVHVGHADAEAYAVWAGKALPTEAEWECAARGGLDGAEYAWGRELTHDGMHMANTWQGRFPHHNSRADGWYRTSPVGTYPANGYGLFDMIGNVWEWTADWWSTHKAAPSPACCGPSAKVNPPGGTAALSVDPSLPVQQRIPRRVIKGGSYLCAPDYCRRYRPAARLPQSTDTTTGHLGFRCVVRHPIADGRAEA